MNPPYILSFLINSAKSRKKEKYREADKKAKRTVRKDKRLYIDNLAREAEEAANKGHQGTLYGIVKMMSGGNSKACPPVRNKEGEVITNEIKQLERWKEHFEEIPNIDSEVEPIRRERNEELSIYQSIYHILRSGQEVDHYAQGHLDQGQGG